MDRKKELKEQYKQMKPDMGIFVIRSKVNNKFYLEVTQNLKGKINSIKFQLKAGSYPHKLLQKEWNEYKSENFEIKILEILKYDKDELKTDYSEELDIMKMVWEEKLVNRNMISYNN